MQPNHKKYVGDAIALGAAGLLSFVVLANRAPRIEASVTPRVVPTLATDTNETAIVLRHPLIPGGVATLAELRARIDADPALRAFYAASGFDATCASLSTLDRNKWATVSYRTPSGFAFSHARLLLLAGERVFVDCHGVTIRAACGNVIASAAPDVLAPSLAEVTPTLAPVYEEFPPAIGLTSAPAPPLPVVLGLPPQSYGPGPVQGIPSSVGCCFGGGFGLSPSAPIATPEPAEIVLVIVGLMSLVLPLWKFPPKEEENDGLE